MTTFVVTKLQEQQLFGEQNRRVQYCYRNTRKINSLKGYFDVKIEHKSNIYIIKLLL